MELDKKVQLFAIRGAHSLASQPASQPASQSAKNPTDLETEHGLRLVLTQGSRRKCHEGIEGAGTIGFGTDYFNNIINTADGHQKPVNDMCSQRRSLMAARIIDGWIVHGCRKGKRGNSSESWKLEIREEENLMKFF